MLVGGNGGISPRADGWSPANKKIKTFYLSTFYYFYLFLDVKFTISQKLKKSKHN